MAAPLVQFSKAPFIRQLSLGLMRVQSSSKHSGKHRGGKASKFYSPLMCPDPRAEVVSSPDPSQHGALVKMHPADPRSEYDELMSS